MSNEVDITQKGIKNQVSFFWFDFSLLNVGDRQVKMFRSADAKKME